MRALNLGGRYLLENPETIQMIRKRMVSAVQEVLGEMMKNRLDYLEIRRGAERVEKAAGELKRECDAIRMLSE